MGTKGTNERKYLLSYLNCSQYVNPGGLYLSLAVDISPQCIIVSPSHQATVQSVVYMWLPANAQMRRAGRIFFLYSTEVSTSDNYFFPLVLRKIRRLQILSDSNENTYKLFYGIRLKDRPNTSNCYKCAVAIGHPIEIISSA
jgi:hypothetical protein